MSSRILKSQSGFVSLLLVVFVLAAVAGVMVTSRSPVSTAGARPSAYSLFDQYYRYEPVTFGLKNYQTGLGLTAFKWEITDINRNLIFRPSGQQIARPQSARPGAEQQWQWDQKSDAGQWAPPGRYLIVFPSLKLQLPFTIIDQPGSQGYFTFNFESEVTVAPLSVRIYISNPATVRDAIELYYHKSTKHTPTGKLVDDRPRKSPYDAKWSWHLDPASVQMAEVTVEVCDGLPTNVEDNLDYWLKNVGSWCPWSAKLVRLS